MVYFLVTSVFKAKIFGNEDMSKPEIYIWQRTGQNWPPFSNKCMSAMDPTNITWMSGIRSLQYILLKLLSGTRHEYDHSSHTDNEEHFIYPTIKGVATRVSDATRYTCSFYLLHLLKWQAKRQEQRVVTARLVTWSELVGIGYNYNWIAAHIGRSLTTRARACEDLLHWAY